MLGIILLVVIGVQAVTIAPPTDAVIASVMSRSPSHWTITVDNTLTNFFANVDVNQAVALALSKQAVVSKEFYKRSFWEGAGLIVLSVIGLIRERKIRKMKKLIEQSVAGYPPQGVGSPEP